MFWNETVFTHLCIITDDSCLDMWLHFSAQLCYNTFHCMTFVQKGSLFTRVQHALCTVCAFHGSNIFPGPETGSATVATEGSTNGMLQIPVCSCTSDGAGAKARMSPEKGWEQWEVHRVSTRRHKCSNWRAGVTQMAGHRQKVNYEAEGEKRQLWQMWVNTHISQEAVATVMFFPTSLQIPNHEYKHVGCSAHMLKTFVIFLTFWLTVNYSLCLHFIHYWCGEMAGCFGDFQFLRNISSFMQIDQLYEIILKNLDLNCDLRCVVYNGWGQTLNTSCQTSLHNFIHKNGGLTWIHPPNIIHRRFLGTQEFSSPDSVTSIGNIHWFRQK